MEPGIMIIMAAAASQPPQLVLFNFDIFSLLKVPTIAYLLPVSIETLSSLMGIFKDLY